MQTVFRVETLYKSVRPDSEAVVVEHRPRRAHKKSRYGCSNCKIRHVKCDEDRKNGCCHCRKYGIECNFLSESICGFAGSNKLVPGSSTYSPTLPFPSPSHAWQLSPRLSSTPSSIVLPPFDHPNDIAPMSLTFQYFRESTCATITPTAALSIFEGSLLAIAHVCPYLMHAMLGIAAAHLSREGRVEQNSDQFRYYRKTEAYHWQNAIRLYRQELNNELTLDQVDALITTCMLLGCHSLYLWNVTDVSFINTPEFQRQAKLGWLSIPMGFTTVLQHVKPYILQSAWLNLFQTTTPAEEGWTIDLQMADDIYVAFLDLCNVDPSIDSLTNPYTEALKHLFALLQIENLCIQHLGQLMAFMGRFDARFQTLLLNRDSRALLIFLYWFFLLDRLDLWWIKLRAAQEASAIINFLELDNDDRIQNLLEAPRLAFWNQSKKQSCLKMG